MTPEVEMDIHPLVPELQVVSEVQETRPTCWDRLRAYKTRITLAFSAIVLLYFCLFDITGNCPKASRTAGIAIVTAVWWCTEFLPLHVTACLPAVLFPLAGVLSGGAVARAFWSNTAFLMTGGFFAALAMENSGLHRRIALVVLAYLGSYGTFFVLAGFLLTAWFLSMWISNVATTCTLLPVVLSNLQLLGSEFGQDVSDGLRLPLLLGISYASSIGGLATPVGTPPNLILLETLTKLYPDSPVISFAKWMGLALPFSLVLIIYLLGYFWFLFLRKAPPVKLAHTFAGELAALGPMSRDERVVAATFTFLALGWLTRLFWSKLFTHPEYITDGTVALIFAIPLFMIPSQSKPGERLLEWKQIAHKFPFDVLLVIGGGIALADGFTASGLSVWLTRHFEALESVPFVVVAFAVCLSASFLTEVTSNTATTTVLLPVVASIAVSTDANPIALMLPVCFACSFAFMLPMATGCNVLVYGTGQVTTQEMMRTGVMLNMFSVALLALSSVSFMPAVAGYNIYPLPAWAGADEPDNAKFVCPK